MDDVTRFLQAEGLNPVPQRFLDSDFQLGQRIDTERYVLTYRQEGERLILCDFAAKAADSQATIALMALLRRVVQAVCTLRFVDAMILPDPRDPALDRMRRRLAELMVLEGAQPVRAEDGLWLRYACR